MTSDFPFFNVNSQGHSEANTTNCVTMGIAFWRWGEFCSLGEAIRQFAELFQAVFTAWQHTSLAKSTAAPPLDSLKGAACQHMAHCPTRKNSRASCLLLVQRWGLPERRVEDTLHVSRWVWQSPSSSEKEDTLLSRMKQDVGGFQEERNDSTAGS